MARRDEVLKEKIEVSLDSRQVFYLFFGGAVVCALCFVLGVMIGRKVEARTQHHAALELSHDPLAALDQLEVKGEREALVFPEALLGGGSDEVMAKVDDKIADAPKKPAVDPSKPAPKESPSQQAKKAGQFTLQLSSFRDRDEATAFVDVLRQAGYEPYVTAADVPGRGRFYRVRVGKYASYDAALAAKGKFEERQKIIAYVTRLSGK